jgi:hypothetical protein
MITYNRFCRDFQGEILLYPIPQKIYGLLHNYRLY